MTVLYTEEPPEMQWNLDVYPAALLFALEVYFYNRSIGEA